MKKKVSHGEQRVRPAGLDVAWPRGPAHTLAPPPSPLLSIPVFIYLKVPHSSSGPSVGVSPLKVCPCFPRPLVLHRRSPV